MGCYFKWWCVADVCMLFWSTGVKNADENELRSIASDPDEIHMYNVNDFSFLLDIVDDLTVNLCNSVKGPGKLFEVHLTIFLFHTVFFFFKTFFTDKFSCVYNDYFVLSVLPGHLLGFPEELFLHIAP